MQVAAISIEISTETPSRRRCRACLRKATGSDRHDFVDLLAELDTTERSLLQCFNKCTQLKVAQELHSSSGHSNCRHLCSCCVEQLRISYQFINRAIENDKVLASLQMIALLREEPEIKSEFELQADNEEIDLLETLEENVDDFVEKVSVTAGNDNQCHSNTQLERELEAIFGSEPNCEFLHFSPEYIISESESLHANKKENLEERSAMTESTEVVVRLLNSDTEEVEGKMHFFEFKCELCTAKYELQRELMLHYEQDHDNQNWPFTCDSCGNRFYTKNALRIHKRQIHLKYKYIDCQECGRHVQKSFYKVHLKRHSSEVKFLCSKCPKTFTSQYTLKKHLERHAHERDRCFECADCGRKFYTYESLQLHQVVHQNRASYSCTLCTKTFLRQSNLMLHMRMHRGETMDCPHCGKKFVRSKDMEIHIRFHTGEYPFSCSSCDRKFAIKSHLKSHEKRHSGVRYKCTLCDKEFVNMAGLRQHSYEHTGMPLECTICKRGFPTKFKMRRHLRCVHHNLFELDGGYTDALAEHYIIQREVEKVNLQSKNFAAAEVDEDPCMEMIEMLEEEHEHEGAI